MAMPVFSSPVAEPVSIRLPLSKSIAARTLVATFWSGGCIDCMVLPDCADTRYLQAALSGLRQSMDPQVADGMPGEYYLGEGGTSLRFFLPVIASMPGVFGMVDCGPGLRKRPLAPLLDALRNIGATIVGHGSNPAFAPFYVRGESLNGGRMPVDVDVSSQFVSGLMLTAPVWEAGLEIEFGSAPISYPYIRMTADVMRKFGARVDVSTSGLRVEGAGYEPSSPLEIESDWSAASYFYEYLLCASEEERTISLSGLLPPEESMQGDSRCAALMETLGVTTSFTPAGDALVCRQKMSGQDRKRLCSEGVKWNLGDTPDLVPALAVGCCVAGIPFRFEGIAHLRYKECDRMEALTAELGKIGYKLFNGDDFLEWKGERVATDGREILISTYGDHRMAMAFAVAGVPGVRIGNPEVVSKSFPSFWRELSRLNRQERQNGFL